MNGDIMRLIIAGSRTITQYGFVEASIAFLGIKDDIEEIVCGMAAGVDTLGMRFAKENNIPVKQFPANWYKYNKSAGPIRNAEMAQYANALLLIWDGVSKGSKNMLEQAGQYNLKLFTVEVKAYEPGKYYGQTN